MKIDYIMLKEAAEAIKPHVESILKEMVSAVESGRTDNPSIRIVEKIGAYIDLADTPAPQDTISKHFRGNSEGHVMLILSVGTVGTSCCTFVCEEPQEAEDVLRVMFAPGTSNLQEMPERVQRLWNVEPDANNDLPLMEALARIVHYSGVTGMKLWNTPVGEIEFAKHPTKRLLCQSLCEMLFEVEIPDGNTMEVPLVWGRAVIHVCRALERQANAVLRVVRKQGVPKSIPSEMLLPAILIATAERWVKYYMSDILRSSWMPVLLNTDAKLWDAFLDSNPHEGISVTHAPRSSNDDYPVKVSFIDSSRDVKPS